MTGHSCVRNVRQLLRDSSGVAAVEFALIMPFMLLLTVGIMDLGMLLMKYRHASQVAASLAQTGAQLSVLNRDGGKVEKNALSKEHDAMLQNGLLMIMGKEDAKGTRAEAKRVIRSDKDVKVDWTWSYGGKEGGGNGFPLDKQSIMAQTAPGESILVVDVSFTYDFFFADYFGKGKRFATHYTAGVPSY